MGEILRIKKHLKNYVVLDKTFIKDNQLSWKAKGILSYLLSCPDGWNVNINDLVKQSTDGKCAVYSALKELTEYGYYKKIPVRDEKSRIIRWESTVSELPMELEECKTDAGRTATDEEAFDKTTVDFSYSENLKVGATEIENQVYNKKLNITKNDSSNIKEYCASGDAPRSFEHFFETIWQKYPKKRGKAKVSLKQKKHLCEIGQEILRAIERYKAELEAESWKQPQNGDTFFTVGYVDYLDANYTKLPEKQKTSDKSLKNTFCNFHQREYDWETFEALLLTTSV